MWAVGDFFKVMYTIMKGAPLQLIFSAAFQLCVDFVIFGQFDSYRPPKPARTKHKDESSESSSNASVNLSKPKEG